MTGDEAAGPDGTTSSYPGIRIHGISLATISIACRNKRSIHFHTSDGATRDVQVLLDGLEPEIRLFGCDPAISAFVATATFVMRG